MLTNSGAREYLLFEAPRAMRKTMNDTAIARVEWETVTGVLGPNVRGIFPPASDVTDVNTSCRSKDHRVLATGDDFGYVKLFNYPVTVSCLWRDRSEMRWLIYDVKLNWEGSTRANKRDRGFLKYSTLLSSFVPRFFKGKTKITFISRKQKLRQRARAQRCLGDATEMRCVWQKMFEKWKDYDSRFLEDQSMWFQGSFFESFYGFDGRINRRPLNKITRYTATYNF